MAFNDDSTSKPSPFITQGADLEKQYLLSSDRVGASLVVGTLVAYASLNVLMFATIPGHQYFGDTERQACFVAFTMQVAAILIEVFTRERLSRTSSWVFITVFVVKLVSCATNFTLYAFSTPVALDPITGRVNSMIRWVEWTVTAFTMTFLVEAIDSTSLRQPLESALSQSISTFLGLLLPLCTRTTWFPVAFLSFVFYFHIFARLAAKKRALAEQMELQPSYSYALRKAQLAVELMRQCVWTWSIFVVNWTADGLVRQVISLDVGVDYPFMLDCLVDVIAKMLYSSIIQEKSDAEPILFGQERMQVVDQRMRVVWNDASDVLMISQSFGRERVITLASPSIRTLMENPETASQWIDGVVHERTVYQSVVLPSLACETVEELVSRAWFCSSFTCLLKLAKGQECRAIEVSSSTNEQGCVIVVRDITDRLKRHQAERDVISADVARQKDEEANALTRHEVKNGVLAAVTNCEKMRSSHQQAVYDGAIIDPQYDRTFLSMLQSMRSGLEQTLETVLSHAMARDVVHGLYVARAEPTRIVEALQLDGARDRRFPVKKKPTELPVVDIDPRLLLHIYRNAVSNACKYGRKGGIVRTEIEFANDTLTLRVINEPGEGHQALVALQDSAAVFCKGTRFHSDFRPTPTARTSSGDGAWIMQQCAKCMQGTCSITFKEDRTVFEMSCPAVERLDEASFDCLRVSDDVWAVGVDDCEFQRFILAHVFMSVGVREEHIQVIGSEREELEGLADILVARVRELPPGAKLLAIIDENLELDACQDPVSGSYAVKQARQQLEPALEARLLALVRSANDSSKDQQLYSQRAHGFLSKERGKQTRTTILRECARRFGMSMMQQMHVELHDTVPPVDASPSESFRSPVGSAPAAVM